MRTSNFGEDRDPFRSRVSRIWCALADASTRMAGLPVEAADLVGGHVPDPDGTSLGRTQRSRRFFAEA
ncbi:MAG: hypothetical protein GY953_19415 [bacterium]|nr:hypothetical protein [bacterium]